MWYVFFVKFWKASFIKQIRNRALLEEVKCSIAFSSLLLHSVTCSDEGLKTETLNVKRWQIFLQIKSFSEDLVCVCFFFYLFIFSYCQIYFQFPNPHIYIYSQKYICKKIHLRMSMVRYPTDSITGASPSDCLVSYTGPSLWKSCPSAEMQPVYSSAQADWVSVLVISIR